MKKSILALSLLLPLSASAATEINCNSFPVTFKITSEEGLTKTGAKVLIVAEGQETTTLPAIVNVVESASEPLAIVNITTVDENGLENLDSSIHARIEIPLAASESGVIVQGNGKIQITKIPKFHPIRMRNRYALNSCTGHL